jgi:hypothetical protein
MPLTQRRPLRFQFDDVVWLSRGSGLLSWWGKVDQTSKLSKPTSTTPAKSTDQSPMSNPRSRCSALMYADMFASSSVKAPLNMKMKARLLLAGNGRQKENFGN